MKNMKYEELKIKNKYKKLKNKEGLDNI